jgi:hypothetical protein
MIVNSNFTVERPDFYYSYKDNFNEVEVRIKRISQNVYIKQTLTLNTLNGDYNLNLMSGDEEAIIQQSFKKDLPRTLTEYQF